MKRRLDACTGPQRERRNRWRVIGWSLAWAVAFLAVVFAIRREWLATGIPATLAAMVPTSLGVITALVYRTFLREADELRRKIELEALALAYAVGVVGGLAYWLLELAGVVADADPAFLVLVMIVAHPLGNLIGHRRYS